MKRPSSNTRISGSVNQQHKDVTCTGKIFIPVLDNKIPLKSLLLHWMEGP